MRVGHSGAARPEGRFFVTGRGLRYALLHSAAAAGGRGAQAQHLILVPPFAEEMNKSRRMFTLLAQRLAPRGWTVWLPDLKGTGESEGDFGDATWEDWRADLEFFREQARAQGATQVTLLGLRLGALLALDAASGRQAGGVERVVLWQPVASGEAFLTQFLRLKLAGSMRQAGAAPAASTSELRARLLAGESIEIAGYLLSGAMARSIQGLRLQTLAAGLTCPLRVLEVVSASPAALSPALSRPIDDLRAHGLDVQTTAMTGEPFWTTVEITTCEPLLDATERCLIS